MVEFGLLGPITCERLGSHRRSTGVSTGDSRYSRKRQIGSCRWTRWSTANWRTTLSTAQPALLVVDNVDDNNGGCW